MSHDVRTPINGIQGCVDIADRYPDDLKLQQEDVPKSGLLPVIF